MTAKRKPAGKFILILLVILCIVVWMAVILKVLTPIPRCSWGQPLNEYGNCAAVAHGLSRS
jgi:hypothetical protein